MKRISWIIFGWAALLTIAQAASFDCSKAKTTVEHLICDTPSISELDDNIGRLYQASISKANEDQKKSLELEQKNWLRQYRNICNIASCLEQAYTSRLKALKIVETQSAEAKVGYCAGPPCCEYEHQSCSAHDNGTLIEMSHVVSGSPDFCTQLMKSHWNYIPLNIEHTVTEKEATQFLRLPGANTGIDKYAGYFDINNDGHPKYLARLSAYSGAGPGCDIEMFVELNHERTHLLRSDLSALLKSEIGCKNYPRAFRFENKTYIENRKSVKIESLDFMLPDVLSDIYIFEGGKRRSVCKFALADDEDEN